MDQLVVQQQSEDLPPEYAAQRDAECCGALKDSPLLERPIPDWLKNRQKIVRGGYGTVLFASCAHALQTLSRRKRLALAALIVFLPVLIPLALAFFSTSEFAEFGNKVFVQLVEELFINIFPSLLALFFAGMLITEDIEMRTMTYILTRPVPRSAWVLGRFLAYLIISSAIMVCACGLTFVASTMHADLRLDRWADLMLLLHYICVILLALPAYGAFAVFLGAFTKRAIIYGVILLYGWQYVATLVPGIVDFFTIQKYTDALLPVMPTQRHVVEIQTALGTFQRQVFLIGGTKAIMVLIGITVVFLGLTIFAVFRREYAADRAAGS